jgi:hypothetical protein
MVDMERNCTIHLLAVSAAGTQPTKPTTCYLVRATDTLTMVIFASTKVLALLWIFRRRQGFSDAEADGRACLLNSEHQTALYITKWYDD